LSLGNWKWSDTLAAIIIAVMLAMITYMAVFMQKGYGFFILIPIAGLIAVAIILREKSRLVEELRESNEEIKRTYASLNETKSNLQLILDSSKVIIITTNKDGKIVEFNKESQTLLEYSKDDVAGKDILSLYMNPEQRGEIIKNRVQLGKDSWVVRNSEVVLKSKSGRPTHVDLTLSTLVDEDDKIIGTVGVGKDISEQKMLQFKLLQSEKLAGIGVLASGIAHEINNPLAGALGMAEAIRDESDPALMKEYSMDIIKYVLNASNIVKELSSYSRHARDESQSTVDLSQVMDYSLKMAKHSASLSRIEVSIKFERDCFIFANEGEMQQVFVNLMVNAIHAMGEKGVLGMVCRKEDNFVVASVSDTGCGISKKDLSYIFDPFFTTKPAGKGTGLGLYVVYKIMTKYGGIVDVESEEGKGTVFTLKFPSRRAVDQKKEKEARV
jgi:PAS domain S-box-containing protein